MARRFRGKLLYERAGPAGWAVIVMPDFVLIDSYHGGPHIHTHAGRPKLDRKLPIILRTQSAVVRAVMDHLEAHREIRLPDLDRALGVND